jgi:hypothetical protein
MAFFENRIAEYLNVFEKRKRKKTTFAGQKTRIDYAYSGSFSASSLFELFFSLAFSFAASLSS